MFFKLSRRVTQEPKRLRSLQVKQFMSLHILLFHAPRPDTRQTSESFKILARGSTQTLPRTTNLQVFYDWDPCERNSKALDIAQSPHRRSLSHWPSHEFPRNEAMRPKASSVFASPYRPVIWYLEPQFAYRQPCRWTVMLLSQFCTVCRTSQAESGGDLRGR
jgi:hypothetical protein